MRRPAKLAQAIPCPTCGAAPGEKCELGTGQPRFEPHQARRFSAADRKTKGTVSNTKSKYAQQNERRLQSLLARLALKQK